jgi:hypothetical protein
VVPIVAARNAQLAGKDGDGSVTVERHRVAILWRGDDETRRLATPHNNRYSRVFEELIALGIDAQPVVYADDIADEVRKQLSSFDAVLVWVNPIDEGRTREVLDAVLRDVAATGRWVSAHPDVIQKMGVKEVLHRTQDLGWGMETYLYRSMRDFLAAFPPRLRLGGPRVLKQNRGNGGRGVWKVELVEGPLAELKYVSVLHALRGSAVEQLPLKEFMARCEPYFASGGCIVDQPFQPRLAEGMIRCYMGIDKVVGFGQQLIKALISPPADGPDSPAAQPGPRIMHPADAASFRALRAKMETEWTPQMMATLGIDTASLPVIWDADFLHGPRTVSGEESYVLCEINVSSVFAIPDQAPAAIARLTLKRLEAEPGFAARNARPNVLHARWRARRSSQTGDRHS